MSRYAVISLLVAMSGCATDAMDEPIQGGAGGKADDTTPAFLSQLPGWGRYIVLDELGEIVPVYLAETRAVLARIDALTPAVPATTSLADVPIADLFAAGQTALLEVLDDADFEGGRVDHDVAWLRQSAADLESLRDAVVQLAADGTSPASFDAHLTNQSYWSGPNGAVEIDVGIAAVSRFYCNVDLRIVNDASGFTVGASESCD